MKTTYLIWNTPPFSGETPIYKEINGKEFLALVRSPESEGRYFVKLPSTEPDGSDGAIVMETGEADYLAWKKEKNNSDYLQRFEKMRAFVSYHAMETEDGYCFGEEMLPDPESGIESPCLNALAFEEALSSLSDGEYRLIEFMYLSDEQGTVRAYEKLTGIPRTTINRQQKTILEKLKKYFLD